MYPDGIHPTTCSGASRISSLADSMPMPIFPFLVLPISVSNTVKNGIICADAMIRLITNGWNLKYIESDGESSFNSDYVNEVVYEQYNIQYCRVRRNYKTQYPKFMTNEYKKWNNRTEPMHTSLVIIDRVTRTIQDIAFNLKIGVIRPNAMKKLFIFTTMLRLKH